MAVFGYSRLYQVFQWFWRRISSLWRRFMSVIRPITGRAFQAIGWREGRGAQDDPEIGEEGKLPDRDCGGQYEEEESVAGGHRLEEPMGCEEYDHYDDDCSERYRVENTDELYCGYDSTWETEENQKDVGLLGSTKRPVSARYYKFSQFESAARDMQNYRHDYPSEYWMRPAVSDDKSNLNFYLGKRPSVPDGVYIHDFHDDWAGDYDALEHYHTYIQWLFPLQERGVNYEASPLTKDEVKCFLESSTAQDNLLKSYKMMLDFFGIELCNEETGEVKRAWNWEERFRNLNTHTHNSLRITRILKCLGTLGYPQYQAPLVRCFLEETLVNGELQNVKDSALNYFLFAVLDKTQRRSLIKFAYLNYDRKDEFVWCPRKIQAIWSKATEGQGEGV